MEGHPDVITLLLTVPNVDVNATDNEGWTPLITAGIGGYRYVIELLSTVPNVDVNAGGNHGRWEVIAALFSCFSRCKAPIVTP